MVQKRTLNIPSYSASAGGATPESPDADVIDVEFDEDGPTLGERVGERVREQRQKARERKHQREQAPRQQRKRQRADQQRAFKETRNAAQQGDPIAQLKLDIRRASDQYRQSLVTSGLLDSGETEPTRRQKLSDLHQAYASMMMLQCLQPLKSGVSAENVLATVGMGSAMWLLSPNFRTQAGQFAGQMGDAISHQLDRSEAREKKVLKQGGKARDRLAEQLDRTGMGRESLSKKWRTRLERIEHAERGHRDPFTVRSAALTEVGLAETAYREMRVPGADIEGVRDRYRESLSTLYGLAESDGLDRAEISDQMRVVVGECLDRDPAMAQVFGELGHGRFAKSPPREVTIVGTTQKALAWTGDFEEAFEGRKITSGSFSLRKPQTLKEHQANIMGTISGEIANARTKSELNDVLSQYAVCSQLAGEHPEYLEQLSDPSIELRVARSRAMFGSMADDGFGREDRRLAYTGAYVDAMELATKANPDLVQEWAEEYGETWKETVRSTMKHYDDAGERARTDGSFTVRRDDQQTREHDDWIRFTAGSDGVEDLYVPEPGSDEDIVDAELVDDQLGG